MEWNLAGPAKSENSHDGLDPPIKALPIAVAELSLEDLSRDVLGQIGQELDALEFLAGGQMVATRSHCPAMDSKA